MCGLSDYIATSLPYHVATPSQPLLHWCPGPLAFLPDNRPLYLVEAIIGKVGTLYRVRWWRWPPSTDTLEPWKLTEDEEREFVAEMGLTVDTLQWHTRPAPQGGGDDVREPRWKVGKCLKKVIGTKKVLIRWYGDLNKNSWIELNLPRMKFALIPSVKPEEVLL
ncbi:hypothetical protein BDN72DRAFT_858098 [Pluteus cervinus]|uniref:Uncharacterized protein n=1 Tax=Pluteus cervinus TaxID=181527 RepID=A0ACD3ASE3_9AGAR|nr:hypothetical protein BDN72DRAFT_858098 [Pluteus cervinus]